MNRMTVSLGFRRRGTRTWVDIDSTTTEGRRLLALFSSEENVMTTTAGRVNARATTIITDPETGDRWSAKDGVFVPAAGTGIIAKVRGWFRGLWNSIKSGWAKLRDTLHLDAVTSRVKAAWHWARLQARRAMHLLGTGGGAGLAMLGISTGTGRRVIGFLLTPVRWVLRAGGWAYATIEAALRNDSKGGVRNWIADRMADGRYWLLGNGVGDDHGFVGDVVLWVAENFGRHLMTDSLAMRIVRSVGTLLLGTRIIALLALYVPFIATIPFSGALLNAGLAAATVYPFRKEISQAKDKVVGAFQRNEEQAEEIIDETVEQMHQTTAAAAAMSAGKKMGTGQSAPNRADRRRAEKASPARPRR